MTRAVALYLVTLSLHTALIVVVLQFRIDKRHPIFFLLLMTSLLSNLALVALRLAREREAYVRLAERADWMWYALAAASLAWAVWRWNEAGSRIVFRGVLLMLVMTLVARAAAGVQIAGGAGPLVAKAMNMAYLAPTVYLILALSNVGIDLLKFGRQLSGGSRQLEGAVGYARAFFA